MSPVTINGRSLGVAQNGTFAAANTEPTRVCACGCGKPLSPDAKGRWRSRYARGHRAPKEPLPLAVRLERKHRVTPAGCWEWTGKIRTDGYGAITMGPRTPDRSWTVQRVVHRVAWILFRGPIPDGLVLDHLCRNRRCFNPDHLRVCTNVENVMADGSQSFSALKARQTHCVNGHEFTPENTHIRANGTRQCRRCDADRALLRYHERKGAARCR